MKINQKGFSAVELVIILVILIAIGAAGWLVYQHNHKAKATSPISTPSTTRTSSNTKKTVATQPNPYQGWLSYCSSVGGLCVKYPSNWKLADVSNQGSNPEEEDITSPSGDVKVVYQPNDAPPLNDGDSETDDVLSETSPASTTDLKIVKNVSILSNSFTDSYFVSDNTTLQQNSVTTGTNTYKDAMSGVASLFVNAKGPNPSYLQYLAIAQPPNAYVSPFTTNAAALAWFNAADTKTATQILASVNYN